MKLLLICKELMTRTRLESSWKLAGATVLKQPGAEALDMIVVDLTDPSALSLIAQHRALDASLPIIAFGPHVDADALRAAKQAGASELASRGSVLETVQKKISAL